MAINPLKIIDVTFRDAQQSMIATRMRTDDMVAIAADMDKVGFDAIEVSGGATFDTQTRYLNEDPWERIVILKKLMPHTPFLIHMRGQNLVGYRNYADDVVKAFIFHAAEVGIDVFRLFDALNDERNLETCIKAVHECGKHTEVQIQYSLTQPKLGGPVYNLDYYVNKARTYQDIGADSICISDGSGKCSPDDAYNLITAFKKVLKVPIDMHTHDYSGMATMACLKAVEAGVDIIDTALAPFSLRSSLPATETMVVAFQGTPRDTGLNLPLVVKAGRYLETIAPKYRDFLDTKIAPVDTDALVHQIPGGMITNLLAQLKEAGAGDKIDEVLHEVPRVRKELGYPPVSTPASQIIGVQAVQNVLLGRYKMMSKQVRDYFFGLYGKPPAPVDPEIEKMALKNYKGGDKPITCRPADILEPELEKAREATKGIARDIGDVLIYALYPTTGLRFLKWKYGLEAPPPETKGKTLDDIKREDDLIAKIKAGKLKEEPQT